MPREAGRPKMAEPASTEAALREALEEIAKECGFYIAGGCQPDLSEAFAGNIAQLAGVTRKHNASREAKRHALLLRGMDALREWRDAVIVAYEGKPRPKLTERETKARREVAVVLSLYDAGKERDGHGQIPKEAGGH